MAARRGGSKKKKRLGAFFAFDEALESLVSIPSTHTLMSPESQDITARTPESDLGKKTASIFQKTYPLLSLAELKYPLKTLNEDT